MLSQFLKRATPSIVLALGMLNPFVGGAARSGGVPFGKPRAPGQGREDRTITIYDNSVEDNENRLGAMGLRAVY